MKRIGEILCEQTKLSVEELDDALAIQQEKGGLIGEILIAKKYIKEKDLYRALANQFNIPFLEDLPKEKIAPEMVFGIPINFAKTYKILPLSREQGRGEVVIANPLNFSVVDDLGILMNCRFRTFIADPNVIEDAINFVYDKATAEEYKKEMMDGIDENVDLGHAFDIIEEADDILGSDEDAPIIRFINTIMIRAVKEKASDIHIEPFEKNVIIRFRIDGVLYDIINSPKKFHSSIVARVKVMAKLDIAEKRLPQDGRIQVKVAGKDIDIRTSIIPTAFGERVVMRLLDRSQVLLELPQIGLTGSRLERFESLIHKSHGIILVTGPTGSGKTTTLYGALNKINDPSINILTVEDPIEYQLAGIGQMQVNPKIKLTFASGLRSFLRQDPDVIMVGEIRDVETADIAIQASLTGHLVLSTLHTNDSCGAITRLNDMGVESFLVASSLLGVLAQRLIRLVCQHCRKPIVPDEYVLKQIGMQRSDLPHGVIYEQGNGCEHCQNRTGYAGRTGIFEMLMMSDAIRGLIMKQSDANTVKKMAIAEGMITLREDGALKVAQGVTTVEEIFRVTQEDIH
jgi:general secretion pathway protein E